MAERNILQEALEIKDKEAQIAFVRSLTNEERTILFSQCSAAIEPMIEAFDQFKDFIVGVTAAMVTSVEKYSEIAKKYGLHNL